MLSLAALRFVSMLLFEKKKNRKLIIVSMDQNNGVPAETTPLFTIYCCSHLYCSVLADKSYALADVPQYDVYWLIQPHLY